VEAARAAKEAAVLQLIEVLRGGCWRPHGSRRAGEGAAGEALAVFWVLRFIARLASYIRGSPGDSGLEVAHSLSFSPFGAPPKLLTPPHTSKRFAFLLRPAERPRAGANYRTTEKRKRKQAQQGNPLPARAPEELVQGLRHGLLPARAPEEPGQGLRHGPLRTWAPEGPPASAGTAARATASMGAGRIGARTAARATASTGARRPGVRTAARATASTHGQRKGRACRDARRDCGTSCC
jgi:hypothetical protein